jgi:hypothetical protein
MKIWLGWGFAVLALAQAGCSESESDSPFHRETETEVVCRDDRQCDFIDLVCTSTFDEVFTTFIDEYNDDYDLHTTITDRLEVIRTDDIDLFATPLASLQTEVLTTTTREEFVSIGPFGDEEISVTQVTTVTVTTWQQDCPTCFVEVCSATDNELERCVIESRLPAFPVCQ